MNREQAAKILVADMALAPGAHSTMARTQAKDFVIDFLTNRCIDLMLEIEELRSPR